MRNRIRALGLLLALGAAWPAQAQEAPGLSADDFKRLHRELLPAAGESPWREIPWLTDLRQARERSVAEDKPIVIFTAADGSPLSRT